MKRIVFSLNEIQSKPLNAGQEKEQQPRFTTPISARENALAMFRGELPLWAPLRSDFLQIRCECYPDNVARARGGRDIFGVEWEFVEEVGGAMVRPGLPTVPDISRWEDFISIPDPESYDWENDPARKDAAGQPGLVRATTIMNGYFERLISLMDFENAIVSLIDEDQQEGVHRFFDRLTQFYERILEKLSQYFQVEFITFHDDWGSQRAPFFSINTCREMILPYLRRVVDKAHSLGMIFELHSCGKIEMLVPLMIEAGVDAWAGQDINDKLSVRKLYKNRLVLTAAPDNKPDMTTEEMHDFARRTFDGIAKEGACILHIRPNPKFEEILYVAGRKAYNPELC